MSNELENPTQEFTEELRDVGWAPGDYMCTCSCGKFHLADKRASCCLSCAQKRIVATTLRNDIRTALADYIATIGCGCCRANDYDEKQGRLAKLLDVPRYSDDSGFNFHQFRTKS